MRLPALSLRHARGLHAQNCRRPDHLSLPDAEQTAKTRTFYRNASWQSVQALDAYLTSTVATPSNFFFDRPQLLIPLVAILFDGLGGAINQVLGFLETE